MKLKFTGEIDEIWGGINEVSSQLGFVTDASGLCIYVEKNCEGSFLVRREAEGVSIYYCEKTDFYRALSIAVDCLKKGLVSFEKKEKRAFKTSGGMLDVSRNAVLRVESVKRFIRYSALMGHNVLYMYMEDTYKLEGYEYFGYMRGAYSEAELKEIVSYSELFGIEVIPCIQTLAHLNKTLKWRYSIPVRDTEDILLIDEEKTYEFIEAMIMTIKRCFKTKKIHIGMDEAHNVGMGAYLKRHGLCNKFDMMKRHLERVNEIVKKYDLVPMIWSDMFFRLGSKTGDYYDLDAKMPENISELIPEQMGIVYWDYYNESEKMCESLIKEHLKMKRQIIFAGGIWIWGSLAANYRKTFAQTKTALKMCKKYEVKDVFATMWGDDGAETSVFEALLGMQLFAEYNFCENPSEKHIEEMFRICTGCDMEAFLLFGLDGMLQNETIDKLDDMWNTIQITKQLFYQDMLLGLFDKNFENEPMDKIYDKTYEELSKISNQGELNYLFDYHRQLVKTLKRKWNIGNRLKEVYKTDNKDKLSALANEMSEIIDDMRLAYKLFRKVWLKDNKPFGLEVIDLRFGGVIARAESAYARVKDYLNGEIECIEELQEEKLYYNNVLVNHDLTMLYEHRFNKITTVQ